MVNNMRYIFTWVFLIVLGCFYGCGNDKDNEERFGEPKPGYKYEPLEEENK